MKIFTAAIVLSAFVASGSALSLPSGLDKAILDELNKNRDSINSAIQKEVPASADINVKEDGSKGACIIPNPFGHGCICHGSASYSVELQKLSNMNAVSITNFTSVDAKMTGLTSVDLTIGADIAAKSIGADGDAKAGVSACKISPSVHGTASTKCDASAKVQLTGKGSLDLSKKCISVSVAAANVNFDNVKIHDTSVKISLGPIPGLQVGSLVDLVLKAVPSITSSISGEIGPAISKELPGLVPKECIPFPDI